MRRAGVLIASIGFLVATVLASGIGGVASAATSNAVSLQCPTSDGEVTNLNTDSCNLSVDKQVSVNGGTFVEADDSTAAAQAHIGDTITWQITLTNTSPNNLTPRGTVYVNDVLPTGVSFQSYTATLGTYTTNDGSFFANDWSVPLLQSDGDGGFVTTLPATLTITTKATTAGLAQNTAALVKYDTGSCDGGCTYADADPSDNSNDAWVNISALPQVLGASTTTAATPQVLGASTTLVNTGNSLIFTSLAAGFLMLTSITVFIRKPRALG